MLTMYAAVYRSN